MRLPSKVAVKPVFQYTSGVASTAQLHDQTQNSAGLRNSIPWRSVVLPLSIITLVGALLRASQLGAKGLWIDEAFSIWVSGHRWPELLRWLVQIDQHPPLYYLALHAWMRLVGQGVSPVRALSAAVSTLDVPVMYALGRRVGDRQTGLYAALLFALSPFHVQFAQEARMYALLTLTVSLAVLALAQLLVDPRAATQPIGAQFVRFFRDWRATGQRPALCSARTDLAWATYILFSAATVLTHNAALLAPLAFNVFVLGLLAVRRFAARKTLLPSLDPPIRPPALRNWAVAQLCVFLLWSPWLKPFFVQATGVYRQFWIPAPTWDTVVWVVSRLTNAFVPHQIRWPGAIWALYALLALLGTYRLRGRPAWIALLGALFATPFVGELVVSIFRPVFYDRTLIWASIPLILFFALGIRQLKYRSLMASACAVLVTVNLLSVRTYYLEYDKEQWNLAAPYVARRAQAGDLLLFHATWVQIPFDYYFSPTASVQERGVPVDLFDRGILEPRMTEKDVPRLNALLRGRQRVWLIYSHQWHTDPDQLVPQTIQGSLDLLQRRRFHGLEVRLYGRRPDVE